MPSVADLQRLADALGESAKAAKASAGVMNLIEEADLCRVPGYARWSGGRLEMWKEYGHPSYSDARDSRPAFTISASLPPSVIDLLQVAAAERVDRAAALLEGAPRQPSTSEDLEAAARVAADAKVQIEKAAVLEAVAASCADGDATVHLSSRPGSSGPYDFYPPAAACILTPSGNHVCIQPMHDENYSRGCASYRGPYSAYSDSQCKPTIVLHAPECRREEWNHRHNCPTVHPIIVELSAAVATALRQQHGLLIPERPVIQIESCTLRTLRISG